MVAITRGDSPESKKSLVLGQLDGPFTTPREAALALLIYSDRLTRKAGSFLGQLVVDPVALTEKQRAWLDALLERAGLPSLIDGGVA